MAWSGGVLRGIAALALMAGLWLQTGAAQAPAPAMPRFDGAQHLGVGACAGPCHARQSALGVAEGPAMRGGEIIVWQDPNAARGRHADAYRSLQTPRGRDIAQKLGIGDPTKAGECLSCHADFAPNRAEEHLLADGVSCEACHGGASRWLASHYAPGATHAQNLANGMYPTTDPTARATLCASCHLGAAANDQFVTHRIMAAGHPRLSFELDLFTALQAHHYEDEDYTARKPQPSRAQVWALGQAAAARLSLERFLERETVAASRFPELYFFDCHACHRPISDRAEALSTWRPNPARGTGPGLPAFNDAHVIMLIAALDAFAPGRAERVEQRARAFQQAFASGDPRTAAQALLAEITAGERALAAARYAPERVDAALRSVTGAALGERYTAYAAAEQAIMAIDALSRARRDGAGPATAQAELDAAYDTVADPNAYDQDQFRARLAALAARLGIS